MQILKLDDRGQDVAELQALLNQHGAKLAVDGHFGKLTHAALMDFQKSNGLAPDGIAGPRTFAALRGNTQPAKTGFIREVFPLDPKQYKQTKTRKRGITWHYTVNKCDPYQVIRTWNNDSRGAVATHFVIGNRWREDTTHAGRVLQAFSLDYYAHHILATRTGLTDRESLLINQNYIGVECCALGNLEYINGKFYSIGRNRKIEVQENEVCILDKPFRTYKYWHKLCDAQIEALEKLTFDLIVREAFKMERRTFDASWFDLSWLALRRKRVLTTHTNFEHGKFDLMPQPEILDMLERLALSCEAAGLLL